MARRLWTRSEGHKDGMADLAHKDGWDGCRGAVRSAEPSRNREPIWRLGHAWRSCLAAQNAQRRASCLCLAVPSPSAGDQHFGTSAMHVSDLAPQHPPPLPRDNGTLKYQPWQHLAQNTARRHTTP